MAKKVSTPIMRQNSVRRSMNYEQPVVRKNNHMVRDIVAGVFLLAIVILGIYVVVAFGRNGQKTAQNQTQTQEQAQTQVEQQEPVEEPRAPLKLNFSGAGATSSPSFELPEGYYTLNYSFSNNAESKYGWSGSFYAEVKCDDQNRVFNVSKIGQESGSGTDFLTVHSAKVCVFQVESSEPSAQWTVDISENV